MTDDTRPSVLFLCTGNACRSQMAEGWLRSLSAGRIRALSAGTSPHGLDARAVKVMGEAGVDISAHTSDSIEEYLADPPDVVITVCSSAAENCPVFPVKTHVLAWPFEDPARVKGEGDEAWDEFRRVRDQIKEKIEDWFAEGLAPLSASI